MVLELKDPKCLPYVKYPRSYTPEQRQTIQEQVPKLPKAGRLDRPTAPMPQPATPYGKRAAQFVWCKTCESSTQFSKNRSKGSAISAPSSTKWVDLTASRVWARPTGFYNSLFGSRIVTWLRFATRKGMGVRPMWIRTQNGGLGV